MSLQSRLKAASERAEREVIALHTAHQRGRISRPVFLAAASAVISRARARGVGLADLTLAVSLTKLRGPTAPAGIAPPEGDFDRLQTSLATVLDTETSYETPEEQLASEQARLGRLATDSTAEAVVWGYGAAMAAQGVRGWVRQTDADPCPVCRGLADGVVRSPSVQMFRHMGDQCIQRFVI